MFAHLIKLIWNRKRSNMLIITEVAITFIVLFAISAMGLSNYQKFNQPLGFNWQNTWSVSIETGGRFNPEIDSGKFKGLIQVLRQQPEFKSVDFSSVPVFRDWTSSNDDPINGRSFRYLNNYLNQEAPKNWGVELTAGRWFGEQDNGQNYKAVMVNQLFVDKFFDGEMPINFEFKDEERPEAKPQRIVGVFKDFRQRGDFSEAAPYVFHRYKLDEDMVRFVHLTFNQPKTAAFEEQLLKMLKSVAPNWEFTIKTWKSQREEHIQKVVIPLIIVSIVVGFLLIMVAMGLFGVLWQNINRRTQEIGLRRAIGASKKSIQLQIISELLVVALFGMTLAFLILVQVPLLQLIDSVTWMNFWLSIMGSVSVMVFMVILCAIYPSRIAIKLAPALALHYE